MASFLGEKKMSRLHTPIANLFITLLLGAGDESASAFQAVLFIALGGRIDHGHHFNTARHALMDVHAFHLAVEKAVEMTDEEDTLIVVTADHSHALTIGGYTKLTGDILGILNLGGYIKFISNKLGYFSQNGQLTD